MPAEKIRMVSAAVAPRHTIQVGGYGDPRNGLGGHPRTVGPGTLIELPEDEARHLIAAGFLLDPQAQPRPAPGPGPTVGQDGSMISSPG
jgi:hypothetical protein